MKYIINFLLSPHKYVTGCHQYAEYLAMVKKETVKALQLFQTCCDEMKFPESCLALGNMYLTGKGQLAY